MGRPLSIDIQAKLSKHRGGVDIPYHPPTKFVAPTQYQPIVTRPQLLDHLHSSLQKFPVYLLSAPAGYGKTTLLKNLTTNFPHLPIAWLTLDALDNEPFSFAVGLVNALQAVHPDCGAHLLNFLTQEQTGSNVSDETQLQKVMRRLISDIAACPVKSFALILDDFHQLTHPPLHRAFDYFLQRLPESVHVVISTRRRPPLHLARLRAQGRLAEMTATDLAFSETETTQFFREIMALDLPISETRTIHQYLAGWPVGVRLLATSLNNLPAPQARSVAIERLSNNIGGNPINTDIVNFIKDEILDRQPAKIRTFLLKTSILSWLTPALCQTITADPGADQILFRLHQDNLFISHIPASSVTQSDAGLDGSDLYYRYHPLFATVLRQALYEEMPETAPTLHYLAAQETPSPTEKLSHYLAADLREAAAQTVLKLGLSLKHTNQIAALKKLLAQLPKSVRNAHPELIYWEGLAAQYDHDPEQAQILLQNALSRFRQLQDRVAQGEVTGSLAALALEQASFSEHHRLTAEALALPIPEAEKVTLYKNRMWASLLQKNWDQAGHDLGEAVHTAQRRQNPQLWSVLSRTIRPILLPLPGGLEAVDLICQQSHPKTHSEEITQIWNQTHVRWWRGELDQAEQLGLQLLSLTVKSEVDCRHSRIDILAVLAAIQASQKRYDPAEATLEHLQAYLETGPGQSPSLLGPLFTAARIAWLQGKKRLPGKLYRQMKEQKYASAFAAQPIFLLLVRGMLAMSDQDYQAAEDYIKQAAILEDKMPLAALYGSARPLLARLYLDQNQPKAALSEFGGYLAGCAADNKAGWIIREGEMVIPLLRLAVREEVQADFAAGILTIMEEVAYPQTVAIPGTGETLTPREVEVLALIADGSTNRNISQQLTIGETTVKTHVCNILSKLHVDSRGQAATKARELDIFRY